MTAKQRRIAFITDYDARDLRTFSGVAYNMARTLERNVGEIDFVDVSIEPGRFERRRPYWQLSPRAVRRMGQIGSAAVRTGRHDLVFCPGSLPIAALDSEAPVVLWKDAAFGSLAESYFTGLSRRTRRNGDRMEQAALERASLILFASDWGAREATAAYRVHETRVHVIPWGANLDADPGPSVADRGPGNPLQLLFVGRPWGRKNGDVALGVLQALRTRGIDAELTVIGADPREVRAADGVTVHTYLDKRIAADRGVLDAAYRAADFLLFPSRHEAYGVVLCEAAAYGVPALASGVGGIPTIVIDGETGFLLPRDADAGAYTDRLVTALGGSYVDLRLAARRRFETVLNWDAAGRRVDAALAEAGL
jgi:glycosyltransferase involved in cell wall biosynthesis